MMKDAMGGYRGSADDISRIIMEQPGNAEAWYNRANAWCSCGNYERAVSDYTTALNIGLRFREAIIALGNRGIARVETGDMEGALADFDEIIRRKPGKHLLLSTAYRNRALVKEKKGDRDGAATDRKEAAQLLPDIKNNQ